jgi:hypothetical protein
MATKRCLITTSVWRLKGFQLPYVGGDQKPFDCHKGMVIESFFIAIKT